MVSPPPRKKNMVFDALYSLVVEVRIFRCYYKGEFLSRPKEIKTYNCINIKMNRKITTAIFGHYNPETTDKTLWKLLEIR